MLKISFDACLGCSGWGFVVRDEHGDSVVVGGGRLSHMKDAFKVVGIAISVVGSCDFTILRRPNDTIAP